MNDDKTPAQAGNALVMTHNGVEYAFTRATTSALNRYFEAVTLKKKPVLTTARMLVRDCTADETFKGLEALAVSKPAIWQTFANELLNDAGFSEDIEVAKK